MACGCQGGRCAPETPSIWSTQTLALTPSHSTTTTVPAHAMSSTTLPYDAPPSVPPPSFSRTPSYSAEPQAHEQRLALNPRLRPRPSGEFTKHSKAGGLSLRFLGQEENIAAPVYGIEDVIEGIVDIAKTDNVQAVDVKVSSQSAA